MGGTPELPFGCATSVGPLPGEDPAVVAAMAVHAQPEFPTVPTLGTLSGSLLAQAVEGLGGLELVAPGLLRLRPDAAVPTVADLGHGDLDLAGPAHDCLHRTVEALARAAAPPRVGLRVGFLGPVTLTLALRAAGVEVDRAAALAARVVERRSQLLLAEVRRVVPDGVVAVVASEPGLVGAVHPTFPLAPAQVRDLLGEVVAALDAHRDEGPLLIGVHVPGRTDWATVISSGVSLISAPADGGMVGWAAELADFLGRGGRVAWGAVPVDQPLGTSEELLWRRLSATWCELVGEGLDPLELRNRSLISPVDGLGHFGPTQAARVLGLVDALSTRVRRQALGARLTLGA